MKDFFKPEDFHTFKNEKTLTKDEAAKDANHKFEEWWKNEIESAPLVYSYNGEDDWFVPTTQNYPNVTHTARLIMIEEIKKECVKHEPDPLDLNLSVSKGTCKHCGVNLIAEWKVKP